MIGASFTYAQDYPDTIYYESGLIRAGKIFDEDILYIKYLYLHKSGKEKTKVANKAGLIKYTIGDQSSSRFSNYTSKKRPPGMKNRYMTTNKARAIILGATGSVLALFTCLIILGN